MLMPKRTKFRKPHRGRMRGLAKGGSKVDFGSFGLQALESAWVTNRQIESARVAITRHCRRGGKVWIRVFPDKAATKAAETRMGKGKGRARSLGRRREAGRGALRDRWCAGAGGARGCAAGGATSCHQDTVRRPRGLRLGE